MTHKNTADNKSCEPDNIINRIKSLEGGRIRPGLKSVGELCAAVGDPQKRLAFIHIAGTNGKGSVSSFISSVLAASGYKVGRFSSPAVIDPYEIIGINGESIIPDEYDRIGRYLLDVCGDRGISPTPFELETVMAFLYFEKKGVDIAVLEAGMGGENDSTNIIGAPLLSVITEIGLDHMRFLGNTVSEIALSKSGIIKQGAPVCAADMSEEALDVIRHKAKESFSPLYIAEKKNILIQKADIYGSVFDFENFRDIEIKMAGLHQTENAALSLKALEILGSRGTDISGLKEGMRSAKNRCRMEIICEKPLFICDGAHNPHGAAALRKSMEYFFGDKKLILIMGVLRDKDYEGMARELAPLAKTVYAITPKVSRGLDGEVLCSVFKGLGVPSEASELEDACHMALDRACGDDIILACGSLSFLGEVTSIWKK